MKQNCHHNKRSDDVQRQSAKDRSLYDSLGRTYETRNYENATAYIRQTQTFDALGRVKRAYNPFRTTSDPTYGYAESNYNALSAGTVIRLDACLGAVRLFGVVLFSLTDGEIAHVGVSLSDLFVM